MLQLMVALSKVCVASCDCNAANASISANDHPSEQGVYLGSVHGAQRISLATENFW